MYLYHRCSTQEEYQLLLTFNNGEKRLFDVSPYFNMGIFKEQKDLSLFKTVRVSFDTIQWANEADFDPEILYEKSLPYTSI
ncbi:MAG: DUF2442 domain-containing protein [Bacteroidia bacterium]